MRYQDGTTVRLGDVVKVPIPGGTAEALVVMLGDTYEHLAIDARFIAWVQAKRNLESSSIVVEWLGNNPFAHNNSKLAPVGKYMFQPLDQWVERVA